MAHLKKRGRYYSVRFYVSSNGGKKIITKSLGTRNKAVAHKMLQELDKLESLGLIDPEQSGFNPKQVLKQEKQKDEIQCATVKESLELFYQAKQHLSPTSVDAYRRAIDHFVSLNDLESEHPKSINIRHFENIISDLLTQRKNKCRRIVTSTQLVWCHREMRTHNFFYYALSELGLWWFASNPMLYPSVSTYRPDKA